MTNLHMGLTGLFHLVNEASQNPKSREELLEYEKDGLLDELRV
jgi:hypothetical protein